MTDALYENWETSHRPGNPRPVEYQIKDSSVLSPTTLAMSRIPTSPTCAPASQAHCLSSTKRPCAKLSSSAAPSMPNVAHSQQIRPQILLLSRQPPQLPDHAIRSTDRHRRHRYCRLSGGETRHFAVNRAHLEDDAGMLKHFTTFAGVDYNRAGVPLIEIVSEPCMHSPQRGLSLAMAVKAIMQYLDASDCNMEEGSLRVDANISVRPKNEKKLRNKVEIKNLNSFHFMEMAIESEIHRQIKALFRTIPMKIPLKSSAKAPTASIPTKKKRS